MTRAVLHVTVTKLLEQAFSQVEKPPASEQDAVAAIVIEELASEQRWSESFAKSQDVLAKLGEKALAEHVDGLCVLRRGRGVTR